MPYAGAGKNDALKELSRRIMFVLASLIVYRIGTYIPVPGLNADQLANLIDQQRNTILGMANFLSGGALERLSIFALGIMPYITASIIMQLLTATTPSLEQLKKEGEQGRRKINQYTRYLTVVLATFQSLGISKGLASQGVAYDPNLQFFFTCMISLITGTMFLMWLGEQMTERGVGNGISLIIFSGIVAGLPSALGQTVEQSRQGEIHVLILFMIAFVVFAVISFVVFMEKGQRRITVNYAQRQQGRRMYAAQKTHLPLKINMAGVIPPIFASSLILFPASISQWFSQTEGGSWLEEISLALSPGQPVYIFCYALLIIFFCFFYTALVFNPTETAENLKKSGAYVSGIRPGTQTARYIDAIMSRLTLAGAIYVTAVCLLPEFLMLFANVPFYFGGTSLLIIVVVVMDLMGQIQTYIMSSKYEPLMEKAKLKGKKGL